MTDKPEYTWTKTWWDQDGFHKVEVSPKTELQRHMAEAAISMEREAQAMRWEYVKSMMDEFPDVPQEKLEQYYDDWLANVESMTLFGYVRLADGKDSK